MAPFAFTYHAVTLEKSSSTLAHQPLYQPACMRVCGLAGTTLDRAQLTIDMRETGKQSRDRMAADIRRQVNAEQGRLALARVRPRHSNRERLLQLADYVTGVRRWSEEQRRGADMYRHLIQQPEGLFWRGSA